MAPMSVIDVVTISSPGSGSMAAIAVWTAAVPEARATAWGTPKVAATSASNAGVCAPFVAVRVPERMTSVRRSSSSSPSVRPDAAWSEGSSTGVLTRVPSAGAVPG